MRIMITGARAPVALELTRALGRAGHTVFAADSLTPTLAGSSRFAAGAVLLPPARHAPRRFADAVAAAAAWHGLDLIVPTCEEVFYLGMAHARIDAAARLLCPPLPVLARLHDKGVFQREAAAAGLRTPRTVVVHSRDELAAVLPAFPRFVLKPAFSRFATALITNCGPHAAARSPADADPTPARPWLVQEFVAGAAECSYSIIHAGHVTAHCAYATPARVGQGSGTAFVSVDGAESLAIARRVAGPGFTGQLALDFIRAPGGALYLLECNPRATSGAHLIAPRRLVGALLDPQQPTWVEPAGRRGQLALLALPRLLGRALRTPLAREGWAELAAFARSGDIVARPGDLRPALAQLAQVRHFAALSRRKGIGLLAATTDDLEWNGDADLFPPEP